MRNAAGIIELIKYQQSVFTSKKSEDMIFMKHRKTQLGQAAEYIY
jgi:hypothetical protein